MTSRVNAFVSSGPGDGGNFGIIEDAAFNAAPLPAAPRICRTGKGRPRGRFDEYRPQIRSILEKVADAVTATSF